MLLFKHLLAEMIPVTKHMVQIVNVNYNWTVNEQSIKNNPHACDEWLLKSLQLALNHCMKFKLKQVQLHLQVTFKMLPQGMRLYLPADEDCNSQSIVYHSILLFHFVVV